MNAAPLHLAGERLMLDPAGVLYWPSAKLLVVADLHLEKGTAAAGRGALLPPWDTGITLDRLLLRVKHWRPEIVVALGDSFHDRRASRRLAATDAERVRRLGSLARLVWVLGNHDPEPPDGLPGESAQDWALGPLRFRHQALDGLASGEAELCGHHHPKASIATRGGAVSRPCFVADSRRMILPAFGAYTGGLDVASAPIARLFPRGGRAFLLGSKRLFSFALGGTPPGPREARTDARLNC
ncbi:ligase-associated DNA damage response endonuclease PdeM [Lichenicoccus sp.]|uniref:ligase-associated DNA damage response endonuclease PdeM n=1 Tax=Lichenicoccus sp. TaxID=2781899 RepID=UPI003D0AF6FA